MTANAKSSLADSFRNAFRGLALLLRTERNMRIHLLALIGVVAAGVWLEFNPTEWLAVALSAGLVLVAEALNTALEHLCNKVHPTHDPKIGVVKDLGAAAVLLAVLVALAVAAIIFNNHLAVL